MTQTILRGVIVALIGAVAGAVFLTAIYSRNPDVVFEMDRDLPRLVSGFYPVERNGNETFAWASPRARLSLPGVNRGAPWKCSMRFRGGRADPATQPLVELSTDSVARGSRAATNDYQMLEVTAPPVATPGLVLLIASSTTFVPGGGDTRELAIQVDSLSCRPAERGLLLPPRRALAAAAAVAAIFGLAFVLAGVSLGPAAGGVLLLALVQSWPLSAGMAPFSLGTYPVVGLGVWIAIAGVAAAKALEWRKGAPLRHAARFVVTFAAAALYLKLLALMHPSKLPVDVVFQAHRLEWVKAGRLFFTQPMPSGVEFPYAIALYVFSLPWTALTRDFVSLLRIVVCAWDALAGALLYVMIARTWNDRRAGAVAVALFTLLPMSYGVIGNANLTNAFGQSASVVALAAACVWALQGRAVAQTAALAGLVAIGLLSHVSTFAQLGTTMVALAVLLRLFGGTSMRAPARAILLATLAAAVLSVVLYYGHFGEVYRNLGRTSAPQAIAAQPTPITQRIASAADLTIWSIGWPIVVLAVAGIWATWRAGARDRLALLVAACGLTFLAFTGVGVFSPVNTSFERYAAEFIGRVAYAVSPAAVILAGRGAVWAWQAGIWPRLVSAALLAAAILVGFRGWFEWFS